MNLSKVNKIFHGYILTVSLSAGLFVAVLCMSAAFPNTTYAAMPFGGLVTAIIPEIKYCTPAGCVIICPKHMLVSNFANASNPVGVYSKTLTKVYRNGNLYQIGRFLLGNHSGIRYPTCPMPYGVYDLVGVGTS